jgi:hypothetical protein
LPAKQSILAANHWPNRWKPLILDEVFIWVVNPMVKSQLSSPLADQYRQKRAKTTKIFRL